MYRATGLKFPVVSGMPAETRISIVSPVVSASALGIGFPSTLGMGGIDAALETCCEPVESRIGASGAPEQAIVRIEPTNVSVSVIRFIAFLQWDGLNQCAPFPLSVYAGCS